MTSETLVYVSTAILGLSLGMLAAVYVGYPAALRAAVALRGPRPVRQEPIEPDVTLIVSAYNEARVIRAKIQNALALDYPRERLEILIVSDASTDDTDAIVREYADRGVILLRQDVRRGKTAGLNAAVARARGAIVVFSDANAMYRADAIRCLVRNFADPTVGCVTGEARYLKGRPSAPGLGERAYWSYEIQVKRLESALGSMVGGDGAIYAIRRELWRPLPEAAINDFLNPLQIVALGYRNVYEPDAVAFEEVAGGFTSEYRRRVRIVSRSWRAIFQAPGVLNPNRVGVFAFCLFVHKVLRWYSMAFLAAALAACVVILVVAPSHVAAEVGLAVGVVLLLASSLPAGRRALGVIGYFAVVSTASLVGILYGTTGRVKAVWTPPRAATATAQPPIGVVVAALGLFAVLVAVTLSVKVAEAVWVTSAGALFYVFCGYPLFLAFWTRVVPRPVRSRDGTPSACVLVAAHNEAEVIAAKIHNTLALDYPRDRLEVVIVSDGSTDSTAAIVRSFAPDGVRLVEIERRGGKTAALVEAMRHVTSDLVVFTDANAFLQPDAVKRLAACFADERVGAVSGDVVLFGERAALAAGEDIYYRYERWMQRAESAVGSTIGVDGALYAIRRSLFRAPPSDTILDDVVIPMTVVEQGYRVVFEPAARAIEQGSRSAWEEFSRKSRVVAGAVQFLGRFGGWRSCPPQVLFSLVSHKALRWLSPLFALLFVVTTLALTPAGWFALLAVAQVAALALGGLGCWPAARRWKIVGVFHYLLLVQAAAAAGLVRGLAGRQSVMWQRFDRIPVVRT